MKEQRRLERKIDGRYYVSEWTSSELRFFSDEQAIRFGNSVLDYILQLHYPKLFEIERNVKEMVEILGFYVFYTLLEAARPVPTFRKPSIEYLSNLFKDKLTLRWVNNVFDPEFMLNAQISALTNQASKKQLKNTVPLAKNPKDRFRGSPSTSHFNGERYEYLMSKIGHMQYARKKVKPLYEIDKRTITKISKILEKLYPDYYKKAIKARDLFLGRPKEGSLRNRFDTFTSFKD